MKKIQHLNKTLCLNFCAYYRPDKGESVSCHGYEVVDRLTRAGKSFILDEFGRDFDRAGAESLVEKLCIACDFRENDCDFMADRTAPPCGGFVLLIQLLDAGKITIDDVK